ncbi:MAG: peptidoglycan-binding protein [Rhodospirillales bacterium]|nr:peptidoglycan-binding protein [Rhodospirillales bacterium]
MSENTNATPSDIVDTKQALYRLGYYRPQVGNILGDWVDREMFGGIRKFQEDHGLKVDGIMRPGGPTETAINRRLAVAMSENGGEGNEPPIIAPPEVDPNMPEFRENVPPQVPPYIDEHGNPIVDGINPWWGEPISPPKRI